MPYSALTAVDSMSLCLDIIKAAVESSNKIFIIYFNWHSKQKWLQAAVVREDQQRWNNTSLSLPRRRDVGLRLNV